MPKHQWDKANVCVNCRGVMGQVPSECYMNDEEQDVKEGKERKPLKSSLELVPPNEELPDGPVPENLCYPHRIHQEFEDEVRELCERCIRDKGIPRWYVAGMLREMSMSINPKTIYLGQFAKRGYEDAEPGDICEECGKAYWRHPDSSFQARKSDILLKELCCGKLVKIG